MPAIMPAKRRDPRRAHVIRELMAIYEQRLAGSVPHHPRTSIPFTHRRAFVVSSIAKACLCSSILCLGLGAASPGAAYWNTAVERACSGSTICPRGLPE